MNIWDKLVKYLAGETNKQEESDLKLWQEQNEQNQKLLKTTHDLWEKTARNPKEQKVDTDSAWSKVKLSIEELKIEEKENIFSIYTILKIAALFVLALGIYYIWSNSQTKQPAFVECCHTNQYLLQDTLPDGSIVYLNKNSEIRLASSFGQADRGVFLTGEAFFDVKRNEEKPFIVYTESAEIQVLGTSFNINARSENQKVEVIVATGKVKVKNLNKQIGIGKQEVELLAGEMSIVDSGSRVPQKMDNKKIDYLDWRKEQLLFKETSLEAVTETISQLYHVKVEFNNPSLKKHKLTANYERQDINSIMDALATTFNIEIAKVGDSYYISGVETVGE